MRSLIALILITIFPVAAQAREIKSFSCSAELWQDLTGISVSASEEIITILMMDEINFEVSFVEAPDGVHLPIPS
mgnify:CR=1 FL=1|jgi:hypothetical protein